jgi:hypothetical protein
LALSVDELEAAPPASSVLPVCRQYATLAFTSPGAARFAGPALQAKPHLRSARAVTHYEVSAAGASGGRLVDFIVDSRQWQIRYLAIEETVEQKKLRFHVLPQDVERFSWAQQRVLLRELQPVVLELESMVPAFIAAA